MTKPITTSAPDRSPVGSDVVVFSGVTKVYPPAVRALDGVSVTVRAGEIHAFVGENGAGKSTLMKVLNGEVRADVGTVTVFGKAASYRSPRDAMADGIGMVHQEILLVDQLTVWENVILGIEPTDRFGRIDRVSARESVARTMAEAGFDLDPDAPVSALSVGARQKVEIAKLLHRHVRVLILDEPTAVLTPQEIPEFFDELRRLRASGRTVCFISHHLDEVIELADRITVLRDGALVATLDAADATVAGLARLMVERDVILTSQRTPLAVGEPVLEVRALSIPSPAAPGRLLGPISLTVRASEVVGIAGVEGNGQHDLVGAIVGAVPVDAGEITINGIDLRPLSILDRRRHLAYVPSERKTEGGALAAPLVENVAMTHHRLTAGFSSLRGWVLGRARAKQLADEVVGEYAVTASSVVAPLGSLSGGNQQKVVLGRELAVARPLVVLDQPTRGVDIGSVEEIHRRILASRGNGTAIVVVSADLDELLRISDRIVVMFRGTVALDVAVEDATLERLGRAMLEGVDIGRTPSDPFPSEGPR